MLDRAGDNLRVPGYRRVPEPEPAELQPALTLVVADNEGSLLSVIRVFLDVSVIVKTLRNTESQLSAVSAARLYYRRTCDVLTHVIDELILRLADELRGDITDNPVRRAVGEHILGLGAVYDRGSLPVRIVKADSVPAVKRVFRVIVMLAIEHIP